ncbi:MAG: Tfp pilus assembly protein FimT/FimU [Thermodesulfovibrionales bacterium]
MKIRTLQAGNRGFTLIELLITSSLIVIFLSVVIINTGKLYEGFLLKETATGIVRTLNRARILAISERKPVILKIDSSTGSYWIESENLKDIKKTFIKEGFKIESDNEGILFQPLGDNTGGLIKITDSRGRSFTIAIDKFTSKITVEKS